MDYYVFSDKPAGTDTHVFATKAPMTEHTNRQFSTDLETTKSLFLQMGGLVETMVYDGVETLITGDLTLVDRVREREKEVNRLEVEIDERIGQIIARNQPAAV